MLFSKGPFISIFASDPHIIIKAINQNLNSVLRDSNINGHDYMRNIVHLPVFLNSRGLSSAKKLCMVTPTNGDAIPAEGEDGSIYISHIQLWTFLLSQAQTNTFQMLFSFLGMFYVTVENKNENVC